MSMFPWTKLVSYQVCIHVMHKNAFSPMCPKETVRECFHMRCAQSALRNRFHAFCLAKWVMETGNALLPTTKFTTYNNSLKSQHLLWWQLVHIESRQLRSYNKSALLFCQANSCKRNRLQVLCNMRFYKASMCRW